MSGYDSCNQNSQDLSFGKEKRLLTSQDFHRVFNQTTFKIHQSHLLFFIQLQDKNITKNCRLGLAITKKKIKRANERNRVKRLVRENFRLNQPIFIQPFDVAVIVKQNTVLLSNAEITQQCLSAFVQINEKISRRLQVEN